MYINFVFNFNFSKAQDTFDYYYVKIHETGYFSDMKIQLTASIGDADVYIGSSWDNRPVYDTDTNKITHYVTSSSNLGPEDFTLSHDIISDICLDRYVYFIFLICS